VTQPEQPQQPTGPGAGTAVAVGAVALAGTAPDPWLPIRWRRFAQMVKAERSLFRSYLGMLSKWIDGVRDRVVHGRVVDPPAVFAAAPAFRLALGDVIDVQVREIYQSAWHDVMLAAPLPPGRVESYLQVAKNRLVNVPDEVYTLITSEVAKAHHEGAAIGELAARIETVLSDNEVATWKNRALVVARTEAIGAYNAGTHAGFLSYAAQLGGEWEHGWLATHDERVRPTHLAADLGTPEPASACRWTSRSRWARPCWTHPGARGPVALPEEVIQCRCSQVLLRPGENLDHDPSAGSSGEKT
jgi:hypothetical protein